jgi:hypothetical protein
MQAPAPNPAEQLAARLLYLQQQKKTIESKESEVKKALEELYSSNAIPARDDIDMLFSDGNFQKVRLQRVATGSYFKVGDDFKDEFTGESHKLQAKYIKAGKAAMAEKACTWKVAVVKK